MSAVVPLPDGRVHVSLPELIALRARVASDVATANDQLRGTITNTTGSQASPAMM